MSQIISLSKSKVLAMSYKTTTLDAFVTLQRGFDLPAQRRIPGDIPIIAANGTVGFHNVAKVNTECVVLGRSGSIGNPQLIEKPFWPLNTTLFVKDFHGNLPVFVYYVLKTIDFKSFDAGGTVPTLNRNHLTQIEVPLLDLTTQEVIGGVLQNLDSKIATNNALSKTLEEIVQTLFKSWFIDFDPVRANMAGEKPKGMDAATAALFPDAMEESELGMIPKGWKIGGLNDIAKTRKELAKVASLDAQINYVGLEHLPRNSLFFRTWSTAERVQSGKTYFKRNDILFGKLRPYFHKVVVSPIDGVCSTDIVVIQSFDSELDPYTASLVNLNEFVAFVTNRSSGTRMPRTSWQEMCEFKILIPGFDLILKFNELMRPLFLQALSANLESNNLEDIRNALLPRLISGDLQIPEEMLAS